MGSPLRYQLVARGLILILNRRAEVQISDLLAPKSSRRGSSLELQTAPADVAMAKVLAFDGSESEDGGVQVTEDSEFKINQDFAKKFTHNKKREELRRRE